MVSRTHNLVAFTALVTTAIYYPPTEVSLPTFVICLIANTVGSMLPDIDQASNKLYDLLPGGNFIGKVFKRFLLGHRHLSHSLLGFFLVYHASFWILPQIFNSSFINPQLIASSLLIGFISHLTADGITEEGLPLFFSSSLALWFSSNKILENKNRTLV